MYNIKVKKRRLQTIVPAITSITLLLSACGSSTDTTNLQSVSGGRSGVVAVTNIIDGIRKIEVRRAALLGLFVSEYLSIAPTAVAAESALFGVEAQVQIYGIQSTVQDPDFELLQAFADALQVDVADLLNRSTDRREALDAYRAALNNVATRSNDRFKELSSILEEVKASLRQLSNDRSTAERDLKNALEEKDFSGAGEKQKAVNEAQAAYAAADLKEKQTKDVVDTFEQLLELYGEKIVAIDSNREILISGATVVDVPGIDDLQIIQRIQKKRSGSSFDSLLNGTSLQ